MVSKRSQRVHALVRYIHWPCQGAAMLQLQRLCITTMVLGLCGFFKICWNRFFYERFVRGIRKVFIQRGAHRSSNFQNVPCRRFLFGHCNCCLQCTLCLRGPEDRGPLQPWRSHGACNKSPKGSMQYPSRYIDRKVQKGRSTWYTQRP